MIRSQAQVRDLVLALERLKRQVLITSMYKEEPISTEPTKDRKKDRHAPGYWTKYGRERRAKAKAKAEENLL